MSPNDDRAPERQRRHLAAAAAALAAGALQAAHGLAYGDRVNVWAAAFATLSMLVEIEVLAAVFDVRRASAGAFVGAGAVALSVGVAAAFAGWALTDALGVPLVGPAREDAGETQTIEEEVSWLKRYAEILETRHRGSIAFHWDIAEATRLVRVPRLLLQPLLENAVKHGALRRREGGEVAVRTSIDPGGAGRVTCVVEDNGPGPDARRTRPASEGALGLELVTRRLALEYAGAAAFRLEAVAGRTRSIVEIPLEIAT